MIIESKRQASIKFSYLCKFKVGQFVSSILAPAIPDYNRISRSKIIVSCPSYSSANALVTNEELKKLYNIYIPSSDLYKYAILKDVDLDFTDDEILNNIDARNFNVVGALRLNRRVVNENGSNKYTPSTTIKLMFEGQQIPVYIYLFHVRGDIEPYMQPVIQCFKCLRFGHTNSKCHSDAKCRLCSMTISSTESHSCPNSSLSCFHCHEKHSSTAKKDCPEYARQYEIKKLMMAQPLCLQEAAAHFSRKNIKSFS